MLLFSQQLYWLPQFKVSYLHLLWVIFPAGQSTIGVFHTRPTAVTVVFKKKRQAEQIWYQTVPFSVHIHNLIFVFIFEITHSKMKTNIRLWMYTLRGTVWYHFCLVWSSISCFRPENVSYIGNRYVQITTVSRLFSDHSKMKTNTRLWMCTLNGTVWYAFCSV